MNTDLDALAVRMARLERSVRRWRATAALGMVLAVVGGAVAGPQSLTVSRLTVVDDAGRERITLSAADSSMIVLTDKGGRDRMILRARDDNPVGADMSLIDSNFKPQMMLWTSDEGSAWIQFRDTKTGAHMGHIGILDGLSTVRTGDKDGKTTFRAP